MATPDDEPFEALLKPLQDINSDVWDIALTKALENYLVQINNGANAYVNFTEAAVLVQNSANFYGKRVDSVHLGCQRFVEKLMDTYNKVFGTNRIMDVIIHDNLDSSKDKENKDSDGHAMRKKRVDKTHGNDDFEPRGPVLAASNINVNLDTIDKYAEKKKVILNKYPKTTRKPNSSCPVYQTKGNEMGLKEEFRLNWRISDNGVLHEDFITFRIPTLLDWASLADEVLEVARNSFIQLENTFDMDVDDGSMLGMISESFPASTNNPQPDIIGDGSALPQPSSTLPPVPEKPPVEKRTIQDPYKLIVFKLQSPTKEFFKRKYFTLPKDLIEEVKNWKLRKIDMKEKAKDPEYTSAAFFDFMLERVLLRHPSFKQVKLANSAKMRRKEILQRKKYYTQAATEALQDCDDDFPGFEPDDDDLGIENINLPMNEEDVIAPVEVGGFSQERDNIMMAAKDLKRLEAAKQTEVARRVQAWHESLADVLDNAERRAQFDVHQYGTMILQRFEKPPENNPIVPFQHVVQNQPKHEIARYLLSTLMLANTYNVEIIRNPGELVKDHLNLKLLSTVRHHEEMDENLRSNTHC